MIKKYQLGTYLDEIYSSFPEAQQRPMIGITANYADGDAMIRSVYYRQIVKAGGTPVIIPPVADHQVIINMLDRIDGLVFTGGADYSPLWSNEEPLKELGHVNPERDLPELLLTRLAYNRQIPILGTCRGMQTIALALGGRLTQDIKTPLKHVQDAVREEPTHSINIRENSVLFDLYGEKTYVNSFHHQAVAECGDKFRVTATAPDGIVEAIESSEQKAIIGVQWHPEWLEEEGSLYDLHKMSDGRQDAVTMVAYIPQHPKPGEIPENMTPKQYADSIFDQISAIVKRENAYVSIAKTPHDLYINKAQGRKSIMLGIENGLAIENDIANVEHFARRGITYITLCHNGDNDICDSARGTGTHNGVSAFGEQVIHEMNRLGVMVDLSHGAEKSFYDALEISKTPIVCSHSNCKALCDVPRNLTDDQLKALAARGGVAQTTMYHGFLRKETEATILDAVAHLEHAIDVMGIDHVGVGTDFDGDGGIVGMADASEMINFTIQLLRRKFSEEDIEKIWGGNWLRVMQAVKDQAEVTF